MRPLEQDTTACRRDGKHRGEQGSLTSSNASERLPEAFKRRIKTQTVLPSSEATAMLLWAEGARSSVMQSIMAWRLEGLMASGQILMRKVDG